MGSVAQRITSQAAQTKTIYRWFTFKESAGDVDGNGIVNVMDVRLLANHVNDPEGYPVDSWAGDVDGSGNIDNTDVHRLLTHVFDPDVNPLNCKDGY